MHARTGPMKKWVDELFSMSGARGARSLFHSGSDSSQRHADSFARPAGMRVRPPFSPPAVAHRLLLRSFTAAIE